MGGLGSCGCTARSRVGWDEAGRDGSESAYQTKDGPLTGDDGTMDGPRRNAGDWGLSEGRARDGVLSVVGRSGWVFGDGRCRITASRLVNMRRSRSWNKEGAVRGESGSPGGRPFGKHGQLRTSAAEKRASVGPWGRGVPSATGRDMAGSAAMRPVQVGSDSRGQVKPGTFSCHCRNRSDLTAARASVYFLPKVEMVLLLSSQALMALPHHYVIKIASDPNCIKGCPPFVRGSTRVK